MMFLDLLGMLPFDSPGSASRQRPREENLTGALGLTIRAGSRSC